MALKLYEIPNNTWIKILSQSDKMPSGIHVPPCASKVEESEIIYFFHVDGMYSFCQKLDGTICHIAAWTEVETVKEEDIPFETVRTVIGRSGYGKDGKGELGEFQSARLCDMSDAWIQAAIEYVPVDHMHRAFYVKELEYRKENGIKWNNS